MIVFVQLAKDHKDTKRLMYNGAFISCDKAKDLFRDGVPASPEVAEAIRSW